MSPRPRKASDDDIFAAVYRVMMRRAPADVTLSEIGGEAGVTAGALVQRFGSKRALLLAVAERSAASAEEWIAGLRAQHDSPLAALYAYADCLAALGDSAEGFAHHLSWLQLDMADAEFRRHLRTQGDVTRAALTSLIEDAVAAGELAVQADPAALARAVEATLSGSLMTWAYRQEGSAADWLRHDLTALLAPYGPVAEGLRRARAARRRRS